MLNRLSATLCAAAVAVGFIPTLTVAQPAPAKDEPAFQFWKDVPDQAGVLAATYIGGRGNEWLVAGGFQADGTVVLVGNVIGPVLELPVPVKVLGTDAAPPPPAAQVPVMEKTKTGNQQKKDKNGTPQWEKPSWRHEGVTAFIVRCSPDLKQVLSAHRLPWIAGAATSAIVAADGAIYIAGRATDGIAALPGSQEIPAAEGSKDGRCKHAFVAKLKADGSAIEWVRHSKGGCDAPQVSALPQGQVRFAAQDVKSLDAAGKVVATSEAAGSSRRTLSISPTDGSVVGGGEHHWATGREPWRCPTLNVYTPAGQLRHQLYDWGGPYVGLDNLRLVSDTAIRHVAHDRNGNIIIYAWSDGGNSVAAYQPTDVRTGVGHKGLGLTTAGAGVLSAAWMARIDPKDYKVTAWTPWLGIMGPNKPNSVWIDNMLVADDGTLLIAGRAARGLWQTHNKLSNSPNTGDYIAVIRKDMDAVRFCSFVPGAGATEVSWDKAAWGIATGTVQGKTQALFIGGAAADTEIDGQRYATPTLAAAQNKFGGGWSDGYVVMVNLSGGAAPATAIEQPPAHRPGSPTIASFERSAPAKKKEAQLPADGTSFVFKPDVPKWITTDAEFRDRAGACWPSFLYGKPVEGEMKFTGGKLTGSATIACDAATQNRGEQSRRLLGELYEGEKPPALKLTIQSLSGPKLLELESIDAKGKTQKRPIEYYDATATLEIAGKKINLSPRIVCQYGKTQGVYKGPGKYSDAADSVRLSGYATIKAADLDLKVVPGETQIDVRFGLSGLSPVPAKK